MTERAEKIVEAAMQLPLDERTDVVARLLESLDGQTESDPHDSWKQEIRRRREEVRDGKVSLVPWETVRAELLEEEDDASRD